MSLHAYTGCDTTSAFKGLGKVKPLKIMQQKPKFVSVLAGLGDTWNVPERLIDDLEAFTCAIYGRARFTSVDKLRHHMIKEKCGDDVLNANHNVDMATMPPCKRTLREHIKRCNFQVVIWKKASEACPDVPPPFPAHGWTKNDGELVPFWTQEEELILPQEMVELLTEDFPESDDDEDSTSATAPEESLSSSGEETDSN